MALIPEKLKVDIIIRNIVATFEVPYNIDIKRLYIKLQSTRGVKFNYEPDIYPALFIYLLEKNETPGRKYRKGQRGVTSHIYASGCISIMGAISLEQVIRCSRKVLRYIDDCFIPKRKTSNRA